MKEEEKYIQTLFEATRKEEPKLSFEEVSETLATSLSPGMGAVMKGWFFKNIYLNSIIVLVSFAALSFMVFGDHQPENKLNFALATSENNAVIPIEKESPRSKEEKLPNQQEEKIAVLAPNKIKRKNNSVKATNNTKPTIKPAPAKQEIVSNLSTKVYTPPTEKANAKSVQEEPKTTITESNTKEIKKELKEETKIAAQPKTQEGSKIAEVPERIATSSNSNDIRSESEVILETALNESELKEDLFVINAEGELAQLLILSNGKFNNLVDINFANKKAIVLKHAYDGSFNLLNDDYVNVVEFNVKRKTAILKFTYNSVNVQIDLEKNDDIWVTTNIIRNDNQEEHLAKEELIQLALDHNKMKNIVEQDNDKNYKEFLIIGNDFLSKKINVEFYNEPIEVVLQKSNHKYNRRAVYAEIKKFQVKKKRASLEFSYKGQRNQINYRKKNGEWYVHSFKTL